MINNVQFTSNPLKQAAIITGDALESFKASRQPVNSQYIANALTQTSKQATQMEKSVASVCDPIADSVVEKHSIDNSMLERIKSFAISHGNPDKNIEKNNLDYLI